MLVLTRKIGQEIRIGDDIVLKITGVQGGRVKIGIDAPRERRISRPESGPAAATADDSRDSQRASAGLATALH